VTWSWLDCRAVGGRVRKDAELRAATAGGVFGVRPPTFTGPCHKQCMTCSNTAAQIRREARLRLTPWLV
jgi:hypothetical protein